MRYQETKGRLENGESLGFAYDEQLRQIQFDDSLESLQDIDWLLSYIKKQGFDGAPIIGFLSEYLARVWVLGIGGDVSRLSLEPMRVKPHDMTAHYDGVSMNVGLPIRARLYGSAAQPVLDGNKPANDSVYWSVLAQIERAKKNIAERANTQKGDKSTQKDNAPTKKPIYKNQTKARAHLASTDFLSELVDDIQNRPLEQPHDAHWQKVWRAQRAQMTGQKNAETWTKIKDAQQKLAKHDNLNAELGLAAMAIFDDDADAAFLHANNAAQKGDIRGQKLLSKFYYQGVGCAPDTDAANQWLQKAADGGHTGAREILDKFEMVKMLRADVDGERKKDKLYLTIFGVVALVVLLLIMLI